MKKYLSIIALFLTMAMVSVPLAPAHATPIAILEIIKAGVKKVIKAVDLKIQRMQNKTIWLQDAQKTLENTLSKLKLDEIADWSEKQKEQYRKYYEELSRVKSIITYYQRIREIMDKQIQLVDAYKVAWQKLQGDHHFTTKELEYMANVYGGILEESLKNIEQISMLISSFNTQMSDAKRLELINKTADQLEENYTDLVQFNKRNFSISIQRSRTQQEVDYVKRLYGID
jgi:hypothetical protein